MTDWREQAASWWVRAQMLAGTLGLLSRERMRTSVSDLLKDAGLLGLYGEILTDSAHELCLSLNALLEHAGTTLVHCNSGKDRTGVLVAVCLSLCGFDDATVADDFETSEEALPQLFDPAFTRAPVAIFSEELQRAPAETMLALLRWIREEHGGVPAFLAAAGFGPEKQAALRAKLLVGSGAGVIARL